MAQRIPPAEAWQDPGALTARAARAHSSGEDTPGQSGDTAQRAAELSRLQACCSHHGHPWQGHERNPASHAPPFRFFFSMIKPSLLPDPFFKHSHLRGTLGLGRGLPVSSPLCKLIHISLPVDFPGQVPTILEMISPSHCFPTQFTHLHANLSMSVHTTLPASSGLWPKTLGCSV